MLYFPFTPCSAAQVPKRRTNASGISDGQSRHGFLYDGFAPANASSNCGMAKRLRFTRQVESSMMMLTGTRSRGFRTITEPSRAGRSPGLCASRVEAPVQARPAPREAAAERPRNSRRVSAGTGCGVIPKADAGSAAVGSRKSGRPVRYLANSTQRISRMTVMRICPG